MAASSDRAPADQTGGDRVSMASAGVPDVRRDHTRALACRRSQRDLRPSRASDSSAIYGVVPLVQTGYLLKVGQLEYDCRYSTMHSMPVTGGRGFRALNHCGIIVSRLKWVPDFEELLYPMPCPIKPDPKPKAQSLNLEKCPLAPYLSNV